MPLVSANRRAENAKLQLAFEQAQTARMRFEALRLAEVADDLTAEVARLQAELETSRAEAARMHGVAVAARIDADQAEAGRLELVREVSSLTTDLAHADTQLNAARTELADLQAVVADNQAKSAADRANLETAVKLAAEFDDLRHDRRVERDHARLDADRNKRLLDAANARVEELEQQARSDRAAEDHRLEELARIGQQEIDEAFAAGSRLGDRAALRVASLETELIEARQRITALAAGGCPDPDIHHDRSRSMAAHPARSGHPPWPDDGVALRQRIEALRQAAS